MAIFLNFSPTSNHLQPLQVENCGSNSRLVVVEDDNGKLRPERVNLLTARPIVVPLCLCQAIIGKIIFSVVIIYRACLYLNQCYNNKHFVYTILFMSFIELCMYNYISLTMFVLFLSLLRFLEFISIEK